MKEVPVTFNPDIPMANDRPSDSQSQLLTNFQQLNLLFDVDHVTWNDAASASRGKHRKSTYIFQGSDPSTAASEIAVYSKNNGLYMRQQSNGTVIEIVPGSGGGGGVTPGSNGSTVLPGGVILKWGQSGPFSLTGSFSPNRGYSPTITFTGAFPNNTWVVVTNMWVNDSGATNIPSGGSAPSDVTLANFRGVSPFNSSALNYLSYFAMGN